jgi:hypothetical protein
MKQILIVFLFSAIFVVAQNSSITDQNYFQLGIYALQSPPGTKGHQNGSLKDIEADVKEVNGIINASIPYRHWDRVNYPDWDFNNYFLTYLSEMYTLTFNSQDYTCIQAFTPPLYSSFLDPPLAKMPEDDRWNNRNLDFDLFRSFIKKILDKEFELVSEAVNGNKNKIIEILFNQHLRPLGGWYLDDEPLVRNHDIEVVETMSQIVRLLEKEFFIEKIIPLGETESSLKYYLHPRYIAFDGDDLHKHPRSSRRFDGRFYNLDGRTIYFKNKNIYTVFNEDVYDVLLLDFYHNDIAYWQKMLDEVKQDFRSVNRDLPAIMPVINVQVRPESTIENKLVEVDNLVELFSGMNFPGLWLYIWDDFNNETADANILWKQQQGRFKQQLNSIKID